MRTFDVATRRQIEFIRVLARKRQTPTVARNSDEEVLLSRCEYVRGGGIYVSRQIADEVISWLLGLPSHG